MPSEPPSHPCELWAGVECTSVRLHGRRFEQLDRSGHASRLSDLESIAGLGVRTLRYPVLWERVAPDGVARADWSWPDERLRELRRLGIRPIVGLLHHGGGPGVDGLLDPSFPERFAEYAGAVAARYPWVRDYVPINEPLTTARFCGLYGVWEPHREDVPSFARIIVNECRATVVAMRAIRRVRPGARLIQNEDVGTIFSTPHLAYQAGFENERRWLTFDLLSGRLDPSMPMWEHLTREGGIEPDELRWFLENPCPPEVLGVDHYATSDRFLDERLDRYPAWSHGGNGREVYTDIEAVRVWQGPAGFELALRSTWERYRRPLAVTEAQLGCTRDEQVRWLQDVWDICARLRGEGVDVRAMTVWSLFGAYEWNSLLRRDDGFYEAGAFDVRGGEPRETAVARWMRAVAADERFDHPILDGEGWWKRPERFLYPVVGDAGPSRVVAPAPSRPARRLLLCHTGDGFGDAVERICDVRALPWSRGDLLTGDAWAVVLDGVGPGRRALAAAAADANVPVLVLLREGDDADLDRRWLVTKWSDGPLESPGPYAAAFVNEALDLLVDGERGVWRFDGKVVVRGDATAPTDVPGSTLTEVPAR